MGMGILCVCFILNETTRTSGIQMLAAFGLETFLYINYDFFSCTFYDSMVRIEFVDFERSYCIF